MSTVALAKDIEGNPFVMRVLIYPCCTGKGLVSAGVAKILGLKVLKVFNNGTLRIQRGSYEETISIRRSRPYYKR